MSKVLIVSRTRMQDSRVCIGGIDLDNSISIRLLDIRGYHEREDVCPYEIGDLWECSYIHNPRRPAPHLEDSNVCYRNLIQKHAYSTSTQLIEILTKHGVTIYRGSINECFEGYLVQENNRFFISKMNTPKFSTCFWMNDKVLQKNDYQKPNGHVKKQLAYHVDGLWIKSIAFVGLGGTPDMVPIGSLVRLSLANWWKKDENTEERCYLQISGVF